MALAAAGLAALQVVPSLLRPPAPPPLAADVGLPRLAKAAGSAAAVPHLDPLAPPAKGPERRRPRPEHPHGNRGSGKGGSERKPPLRHKKGRPAPAAAPTVAATPEPSPVLAPPAPPEVPSPASDGSIEFAPH